MFEQIKEMMISYMYKNYYLPQALKDNDEHVYNWIEFKNEIKEQGLFELDDIESWLESYIKRVTIHQWSENYENFKNLPENA